MKKILKMLKETKSGTKDKKIRENCDKIMERIKKNVNKISSYRGLVEKTIDLCDDDENDYVGSGNMCHILAIIDETDYLCYCKKNYKECTCKIK